MIVPPLLDDEQCRLVSLHDLRVLDTPPEERFDRVTRVARRLFDLPIAVVSLVDADRQWFKSVVGLDVTETSREVSFCGHAIASEQIMVVPDALSDERFRDNPLVTGAPHVRFYAGCPVRGRDGRLVGTLCVIDTRPRSLDDADLASLRDLAGMVEEQLGQAQDATLDALTGLLSRRGVRVVGEYMVSTARRMAVEVVALMFDLDAFKAINDTHGHGVGDAALVHFATAMRGAFRSGDVVSRLSGDEFCVIARTHVVDVPRMLARLDAALDVLNAQAAYRLGYSVGIAALDPARHATFDDWLASADAGIYDHKRRVR